MSSVLLLISLVASNIGPSLESGDLGDSFTFDLKRNEILFRILNYIYVIKMWLPSPVVPPDPD